MSISKIASKLGGMGGKATLKKHGKKYFRNMAIAREKAKKDKQAVVGKSI